MIPPLSTVFHLLSARAVTAAGVLAEDIDIAPNQQPSLKPGLDPQQVSPGALGFIITFILAAAVILLFADMTRRQRRLKYRYDYALQREQQRRAEEGEQPGSEKAGDVEEDASAPGQAERQGQSRRGSGPQT